jgi:hypothetical protein
VSAMISNAEGEMAVIEPEKQKSKKGYTNSGHLVAGGAHIEHRPTLTQVNLKHSGVSSDASWDVCCLPPADCSAVLQCTPQYERSVLFVIIGCVTYL